MYPAKPIQKHGRLRQERLQRHWRQADLAEQLGTTELTVRRWEKGSQKPSAYFHLKLCALFGKSAEELGLVETLPLPTAEGGDAPDFNGLWGVPYPRNPFFTGREDLLQHLHEMLNREHTMALTQSWAISGLGGIGKTQIALEYAYRYRQDYRFVFWASAATSEILLAGFVTIAELLQLPEKNERDQNRVVQAVKQWLASHQEWLLILDNADDLTVVHDVLPTERPGHLLLTTRAQALGSLAQRIEVENMGMAEGTLFLLRRAKILAPEALLDQTSEADLTAAEALVIEMDFLPLALDQAGAYIEEIGCSLAAYLELYRTHRAALLQRRGHMPTDHPEPVATTWSLNFQKVEQANPAAADLLRLCAFLEPDTIPEELFSKGSATFDPVLQSVAQDVFRLNEAIEELRKFSLIQRNAEARLLRIHRLVQAVLKDAMERVEQRRWAEQAVRATSAVFPETVEKATWPHCLQYLSQAQACAVLIEDYTLVDLEAALLLHRTASYLRDAALYEQAELLFQQDIRIHEQKLGSEHPKVAQPLNGLAIVYYKLGRYEEAEILYRRALCIREQAFGPDHPDVCSLLNNLAVLYQEQGKYVEAEPLFQRVLRIREQALGPDHLKVALALNGLAVLYAALGRYEEAEPLYQRALRIREQAFGPDHPDVAQTLENLVSLYSMQGKDKESEHLGQRALRIHEQAWGPDHPGITISLNNLADLYKMRGKFAEAEHLYQRALHIREQALGPNHPGVAYPLNGLANLHQAWKRYEEAEPLYQRALRIRGQALGEQHPDTAETLHDFATLRAAQGNAEEAASLYQRALSARQQILGEQHPKTCETRECLRAVLQVMGKTEEEAMFDATQSDEMKRENEQAMRQKR
jgi:tetratricopeptide (TPR) repeat protein/DNA-binding XRE family transcriptional regulator